MTGQPALGREVTCPWPSDITQSKRNTIHKSAFFEILQHHGGKLTRTTHPARSQLNFLPMLDQPTQMPCDNSSRNFKPDTRSLHKSPSSRPPLLHHTYNPTNLQQTTQHQGRVDAQYSRHQHQHDTNSEDDDHHQDQDQPASTTIGPTSPIKTNGAQ